MSFRDIGIIDVAVNGIVNYTSEERKEKISFDELDESLKEIVRELENYGIDGPTAPEPTTIVPVEILNTNISTSKYEYKYSEQAEVHIIYETDVPINQSTVVKDETIKVHNKNGANAKILSIENLEKETIVVIDVGNKAGEFTLELSNIKNENDEKIIPKSTEEFLIGTRMQRITKTLNNIGSTPIYGNDLLENIIDDDINTLVVWAGYNAYTEIIFKSSENMENITLYVGVCPRSVSAISIEGLQGETWKKIGETTQTLSTQAGKADTLVQIKVTAGEYDGIRIKIENKSSWVSISKIFFE